MIKNYFKLGLRNLAKNRLSSSVNILGLALAAGCCLVVFQFLDWALHMDRFHPKLNNLFVIERVTEKNGDRQIWGNSPSPLGSMLKVDFPQIQHATRLSYNSVIIKEGENIFREEVSFVDDDFYRMFQFPVRWGNETRFTDPDGIILTYELSEKLFGKENPVGRSLIIHFAVAGRKITENFTVKGVFDKRPLESSFYFSALIPYQRMLAMGMDETGDWGKTIDVTFIEADNEAALTQVMDQEKKYLQLYNAANRNDRIVAFNYQPLKTMAFEGYKVNTTRFVAPHIASYIMLVFIAIATLILVYFNYMNIAIASASNRLMEIGIRKVMGSSRRQIALQFMFENLILCTFAILIGLFLAKSIFLPWFNRMVNMDFAENLFTNYRTWAALLLLILISAFSGAAYPSILISAFKPIDIIRGSSQHSSSNYFRKTLLGVQFFLTFLAICMTLSFIRETKRVKAKPWGYDASRNIVINLGNPGVFETFKNELSRDNDLKSVTGSVQPLGKYSKQLEIKSEGKDQGVQSLEVLLGFATHFGMKIIKGRDLNPEFESDKTSAVLVNQAFLKRMNWTTGIGKNIENGGHHYQIIGEIEDFHFEDFQTPVGPLVLTGCKPEDVNFVYVKTVPGLFSNAQKEIEKKWRKINPNMPFEYYYQEGIFDPYYDAFRQISQVMGAASLIMIVISMCGIFGLALLILGKKMKEISIRKVLGAGMANLIFLINKEFLFAIGFAMLFGWPAAWWLTSSFFNQLSPESIVSGYPFVFSFIALLIMTALSVSWHIYKANTVNPVKYLKDE